MGAQLSDDALLALLNADPHRGWGRFIERYTPVILARLEWAGLRDQDEKMEVYTLVCERLVADRCARLRSWKPGLGTIEGWLSVVVRHVVVDWVRSRAGRRRMFGAVRDLAAFDRRVFEAYYWEERPVAEIAGVLSMATGSEVGVGQVMEALGRVNQALTERHRADLLSMACRTRPAEPLQRVDGEPRDDLVAREPTPELAAIARETQALLDHALKALSSEDAAIVRLHVEHGLTIAQVREALRLPALTRERIAGILGRLRASIEAASTPPAARPSGGAA